MLQYTTGGSGARFGLIARSDAYRKVAEQIGRELEKKCKVLNVAVADRLDGVGDLHQLARRGLRVRVWPALNEFHSTTPCGVARMCSSKIGRASCRERV